MPVINRIAEFEPELRAWRRHLHTIPELDFDLFDTAAFVAARLREIGVDEIHEGIARTGIVALIRGRAPGPAVGLRADMDALPILEAVDRPWKSTRPGRMHACGHDGHTTILLGAARYLAETRNFAGTVALIFQPSEEMSGGGRVMVEEGMMERFGIGRVFGIHNEPGRRLGEIGTRGGPLLAAADDFRIVLRGRGGHAAYPAACVDPVPAALAIGQALMTIPARRADPLAEIVVSLTVLSAGEASNVIPETAELGGTVRTLDEGVRVQAKAAVEEIVAGCAAAYGVEPTLDYRLGYPVLVNDAGEAAFCASVAAGVVGEAMVAPERRPEMGAEDFAYMLQARPGAYVFLGAGDGAGLHHPAYDYNDEATPIGASYFVRLVEAALPLGGRVSAGLACLAMLAELGTGYPDRLFRAIGHPVSWVGWLIAALDRRLNHPALPERRRWWNGVATLALVVTVSAGTGWAVQRLAAGWAGLVVVAVLAGTLIAQRSLASHVGAVARALEVEGLDGARQAVARIVGRDPESLDEAGVARAAVESLAENFSDGVVAPVFWLAVAGLPGAAVYKAVNTADSMIGHRSAQHRAFGWAAARLDDLLNLPASRLAALLLVGAAALVPGASAAGAVQATRRDAGAHRSPNAGWPEAAMAGALGLALAGPRRYGGVLVEDAVMGRGGRRTPGAADVRRALRLYWVADGLLVALVAAVALVTWPG